MTAVPAPGVARRSAHPALRWLPWVALVVVVAVALAVGVQRHSNPTLDQRVLSIAGEVKCPVCTGETAAQSQTPASQELRGFIRKELVAGQSRATILNEIQADYGVGELENPPAQGIDLVLWVVPGIAVVLAAIGLVLLFRRWRPARVGPVSDEDRALVGGLLDRPGPTRSAAPDAAPPGSAPSPGSDGEPGPGAPS